MEKATIEFEIDIEMQDVYDRAELVKVLKKKLIGYRQYKSLRGHTFKIKDVRDI